MTTVDIEHLLLNDELQQLLEAAEQAGSLKAVEIADVVETLELDALEQDALYRELDRRGIEIVEEAQPEEPAPAPAPAVAAAGDDDRCAAALPARGRAASAADGAAGGRAREEDRARRHAGEAAHDPVQPPAGRLDRQELPESGAALPRPDPGGHARPDPCGREVRLASRLQVLDLRHLVDPAGRGTCARRQGPHDPDARPHRRAAAEDEPCRADALDAARP